MISKLNFLFLGLISSAPAWAFNCNFTLVKGSCWTKYNVSVEVSDAITFRVLTTIVVPANTSWSRQEFSCEPGQKLAYKAKFSPVIWEQDKDKTYQAKKFWFLPDAIKPGETGWSMSICYPSSFLEVPLPPDATNDCHCDYSNIPKVLSK